ncbi:Toxin SymE, type I toxin-antitoxin system [Chitinophaga sp. 180180018-2]|uniref:SymE family type I addiction module toxin n=1 Tax=unclassified Chitinophaga TaxID=2619133 RepID=UPI002DEA09AE|nr:Toxin SymE, type I toxin-antitoxin system [Chitinophaga sp. 212800010-3]
MKNRKLKTRFITVKQLHQGRTYESKSVSCIQLAGVWLQEAGFIVGDRVNVHVRRNRLVITNEERQVIPLPPEPTPGKRKMQRISRLLAAVNLDME